LVDKEDSIHIKIKIDIDADDKAFIENLSSEIARADEQIATGQIQKKGKKPKIIPEEKEKKKKPQDFGVPTFEELETRHLKKFIDKLEKEMGKRDPKDPEVILEKLQAKKQQLLLKQWKEGNVGKLQSFTQTQMSNLRQAITNPPEFMMSAMIKGLGRFGSAATKGGIYAVFALLIYSIILFTLNELMKPGRMFDRRFRRVARDEVFNFFSRQLQEEIRQGYQDIRITTVAGLRGGLSQVNGNLFQFSIGKQSLLQHTPFQSSHEISHNGYVNGSPTVRGNVRRPTVSGRFG